MIPQCNPKANYKKYREEIDKAISKVLSSGSYVLGEQVTSFEDEFSSFLGIS
ncbi:MAG: erythromycin biosynthesis sensory transduction protein eryC1, partial [Chloroflexi bacterium]|nr:erythromycin biosynthesis sensory transduction protein eryC1 [Chloroflexota bacterium]